MLKVVIIGYGEMFTNLIAGTLDSGMEIVGVLRKETIKYPPFLRWLKDIFNPLLEVARTKDNCYKKTVEDYIWQNRKYINAKWFKEER